MMPPAGANSLIKGKDTLVKAKRRTSDPKCAKTYRKLQIRNHQMITPKKNTIKINTKEGNGYLKQ